MVVDMICREKSYAYVFSVCQEKGKEFKRNKLKGGEQNSNSFIQSIY